ncbi:bacteriorhodopsin [Microbacterium sp. SLBN-154]|uniref:bacteriorhodopsin n=1 Tax=Microbacterium sp. SLBN-154 TaxID=2768458 RepID=UPI001151EA5F|nr:bacteriorhodopsin [Microbacterium sp. SLBN-154]TQK17870.1 bacteriorhodopsin [Microbacterium sp. SLBN-154]
MDFSIVQSFFMLGFVAMAAGTFWFFMERNDLKPEYRSVASYAAVITLVAAILYYVMKDVVQFPGGDITAAEVDATLPLRYIDWLITTPLLLVEFGLILAIAGAVRRGFVAQLIVADIIMIVFGYLGEIGVPGSAPNWIFFIISVLAWLYIVYLIFTVKVPAGAPAHVRGAVQVMRLFVVIGWSIYPLGTAIQEFIELGGGDAAVAISIAAVIYVIADVLNKVGFGLVAVRAAKKSSVDVVDASPGGRL